MKSDLDRLMHDNDLDAILVIGPGRHNPAMVYLTGGQHLTHAILVMIRDESPILFHSSMERDEAARSGLVTRNLDEYGFDELLSAADGDELQAVVARYQRMFADIGLKGGRMAVYGRNAIGPTYATLAALQRSMPSLTVVGELNDSVLMQAMTTKDGVEIERIRRMGTITTRVVERVANFLKAHRAREGVLMQDDGTPLTIGEVKRRIDLWLTIEGAENPEGSIFAIGKDAGVPHSTGQDGDVLRLGQPIVFDIFPCETGGGYYYDLTRTWCLGHAPDEVQALFADVQDVFNQVMESVKPGVLCRELQEQACDLFEARGHPTVKSHPQTQAGYVHSLGHGLGLHVHEQPSFRLHETNRDRLEPGMVVTIEPGLYYPERGMGVRLENTVWVRPDGEIEVLADYPFDLVLPVESE